MINKLLLTGNEAAVLGAIDAGAKIMFGYPITPATEILQGWIEQSSKSKKLSYLQTEDEIAAGFGVIGSVLAGVKSFTASAGPGHILLQDPISMAENMRLPFVGIMMQRGGPSTGTVNFSQQEVNLAAFGGNGDGLRVVYSASSVAEMYEFVIKSFNTAWKYRFPTFLLGDGYLGKMKSVVTLINDEDSLENASQILKEEKASTNLRNCYSSEESFGLFLKGNIDDWEKNKVKICESQKYKTNDCKILIIAHGLVAAACKEAVSVLRNEGKPVGLFRPITLNPFDINSLKKIADPVKKIIIIESSLNQLSRIVKYEFFGTKKKILEICKPAQGFSPDEIVQKIKEVL